MQLQKHSNLTTHKRSHGFGWMVVHSLTTNESKCMATKTKSYSSGPHTCFRGSIILFVWVCHVNLHFIASKRFSYHLHLALFE